MSELQPGVSVVLGAQWGDEGKGKLVDILADHADLVARCAVRHRSFFFYFCVPCALRL